MTGQYAGSQQKHYVCTNQACGTQIAYDRVSIEDVHDGFVITSQHTLFNTSLPTQLIEFSVNSDWSPKQISLKAGADLSAHFNFEPTACHMALNTPNGEHRETWPVPQQYAYVLLSGVLYMPMHIVRRYDFESSRLRRFHVVPSGLCDVSRVQDVVEDGVTLRVLRANLFVEGVNDVLDLFVNEDGDLVKYTSAQSKLAVTLEQ